MSLVTACLLQDIVFGCLNVLVTYFEISRISFWKVYKGKQKNREKRYPRKKYISIVVYYLYKERSQNPISSLFDIFFVPNSIW